MGNDDKVASTERLGPARGDSDGIRAVFERFGLTGKEALVLLGLMQFGSATAIQLCRFAEMDRANVYRVLDSLCSQGLAMRPNGAERVWTALPGEEVMDHLWAIEKARYRELEGSRDEGRRLLEHLGADAPASGIPYVHILRGDRQFVALYHRLLTQARFEILVMNRGPYHGSLGEPHEEVLEAAARGVSIRALYVSSEVDDPRAEGFRAELAAYAHVGVKGRVVDAIPLPLAIFDRCSVLIPLEHPLNPLPGGPTPLHIEHPHFGAAQGDLFDHYWSRGGRLRLSGGSGERSRAR